MNWVNIRHEPKGKEARAGGWGTIAQCLGGDIVCAESCDGTRYAWLDIGYTFPGGDVMSHVFNAVRGCIDLRAPYLRHIRGFQRCRFLGVRSK